MISGVSHSPLNGRLTTMDLTRPRRSYEDAKPQNGSGHWCSSENNSNNARYVNFGSGNANNNNKYNQNVVRPVVALGDYVPAAFVESVWEAYHDCLRGKMRSSEALEYMSKATEDIPRLAKELWNGAYKPTTSTCFLVKYPKLREVFAANFRDRIVHHWICLRLNPLFENRFFMQGNVSFNCRSGFGVDKAVAHVARGIKMVSHDYQREAWVFRGDLCGFFMSIDKDVLWERLERFTIRRYHGEYKQILLEATKRTIYHHPERDCVLNSPAEWWGGLEANKSLFTARGEVGMPIGNLTTQLFANFLMSWFVSYVQFLFRHEEYCFAQFVDDFIIVAQHDSILRAMPKIEKFLEERLRLHVHKDKRYFQPVTRGVSFVGTIIKPGRLYLSNRTRARLTERCYGFRKVLGAEDVTLLDLGRIEQVLNSYLGFCRRRRTYRFRKRLINRLGERFWEYYYVRGHYDSIRLKKKYQLIL